MPPKPQKTIDLRRVVNAAYQPYLGDTHRYLVCYGGAGSGKSWFAAQKIILRTISEPGHKFAVVRKVARTLRHSVYALLLKVIADWGLQDSFAINKTEMTLEYRPNGSVILCMGLDDPEKVKSIAGLTGYWLEEPTELMPEDLMQLNLRLRGETTSYKQIILSFNPISHLHWLKARFFDDPPVNVQIVHTTYKDNAFIDEEYKAELERLKDIDPMMYAVYCLGEWGVFQGVIYPPFENRVLEGRPDFTIYGLDFGYNDPTVLMRVDVKDRDVYLLEDIYESKLTTSDLITRLGELGVSKDVPIYADSAEPDRIEELTRAGYNVWPCVKGQGSVNAGIVFCKGLKIYTRPENVNLALENSTYKWAEDRDGRTLDKPVEFNDHAMDAMRYALYSHMGKEVSFQMSFI